MEEKYYIHAMWRVQPGREEEFIAAWQELSNAFSSLEKKPLWGSLLQSLTEPTLFFSFGPWQRLPDIEAMRANPEAQAVLSKVRALCQEATLGVYRLAASSDAPVSTELRLG
ncbi:MAG: antibiotic biosynthesis monooxygenase [Caldilineaceae bacterium]|nr:antibiotic biosynthesis monooxygenase [Caldilineaceae bacterium]